MKFLSTFLFFIAINIAAQETFYEKFGERVFLNKKIISYTIYQTNTKNGITDE